MIRKSALVVIAITGVIIGICVFALGDSFVEDIAELALGKGLNTEVDIEGLDLDPIGLNAAFKSMKIKADGDDDQNFVSTGAATFDLLGMQLLAKKLVINRMTIDDVLIDSEARLPRRETAVSESEPGQETDSSDAGSGGEADGESSLKKLAEKVPELDLDALGKELNIDEYIHPEKLESVQAIRKAQKEGEEKIDYWNAVISSGSLEKEIKQLQRDADALRKTNIKSVADFQKALTDLQQLREKAINIETQAKDLHKKAVQDLNAVSDDFGKIRELSKKDIKNAEKLANLKDIDASHIGLMLFGETGMEKLAIAQGYLETARGFFWKAEETPERKEGRTVNFPVTARVYPKFLIEKLQISGKVLENGKPTLKWSGGIFNITQDQDLLNTPTTFEITGSPAEQKTTYLLTGVADNRNDRKSFSIVLKGNELVLSQIELRKGDKTWPNYMRSNDAELDARLVLAEENVKGTVLLMAKSVQFTFADRDLKDLKETDKIVRDLFKDLEMVKVRFAVSGKWTDPDVAVSTNIDDILSKRLNDLLGEKIKQAQNEIRNRINGEVNKAKAEVEARLQAEKQKVLSQLNGYQQQLENEKKKIEQRVEDLKKQKQAELDQAKKELEARYKQELAKKQAELEKAKKELEERKKKEIEKKKKELEEQLRKKLKKMF